jgi:aspartate 1-decarboxylase
VILIAYQSMSDAEARTFRPRVVHVDAWNRIVDVGDDPSEALLVELASPPHAVPR